MLTIDRLRLHLPPGYGRRAATIGRLLAAELPRMSLQRSLEVRHLRLPPVQTAAGMSNGRIARRIAAAVQQQMWMEK